MLKKHGQFFENILILTDILSIVTSWVLAYFLRFSNILPIPYESRPPLRSYLLVLLPILLIWPFLFRNMGLYKPRRISSHLSEVFDIVKACTIALGILITTTFFLRHYEISRLVFIYFWLISVSVLTLGRWTFRDLLRYYRRKGYNIRRVLIIGAGNLGEKIARKIKDNAWTGLEVVGYLDDYKPVEESLAGKKILGRISDVKDIVRKLDIDQVFIALPVRAYRRLMYVVESLKGDLITIRIVPDIYQTITLNAGVEDFEGIPIINLTDTPMYGWRVVAKRVSDTVFSLIAIMVTAPLMLIIAVMIKITSPGPIFYRQERMGLDGKTFYMLKFRSMRADAEAETGAIWARENDPRRTRLGVFLRKTSLDELPQFFNVLKGDMSIVGPRPERPVFIEEFRTNIPGYMLRHMMKAGITGWAQVNGWRGSTSLAKRIEYDLFYINNWSLWFDLKIMWFTIWKGFVNSNAY